MARAEQRARMAQNTTASERHQKRILVVDDDEAVRAMLARVLEEDGYATERADGGQTALQMIATNSYDLVLLDLGMPAMDGWKTFAELARKQPRLSVIIITARPNQRALAQAAGAEALFEKPLVFPELLQAIEHVLVSPSSVRPTP